MNIVYFLFRVAARAVSLLPFPVLYALSDLLFLKLYYVFRYRRKVVSMNLRNAFPEKTEKERRQIARKFYRHLADVTLEVIKLGRMSGDQLLKHVHFNDISVINEIIDSKKSIIGTIGHIGNWEWMSIALQRVIPVKGYAIVKPLTNPFFNRYLLNIRNRLLIISEVISYKLIFRKLVKNRGEISLSMIAADQTPHRDEINYWCTFLNQETAFFLGVEKMATSLNSAVIYLDVQQSRRGHYDVDVIKITDEPTKTQPYEIIQRYVQLLEASIRNNPYNWLWSHRRWKYKREENGERREEKLGGGVRD